MRRLLVILALALALLGGASAIDTLAAHASSVQPYMADPNGGECIRYGTWVWYWSPDGSLQTEWVTPQCP